MNFLSLIPFLGTLVDKVFPDAEAADKVKLEMLKNLQKGYIKELEGRFNVLTSEGASKHWIAAAWRPVTMLTFLAMIVSYWFGYVPENVTEPILLELFGLLKIGLGGYVVAKIMRK